ncbi:2-succinyl-5-enolpyruvyl-6-hydroxy-3-cyclohexene-1-carboxylic-acid synthase [Vibrio sp.]|nr:2-succinyl-5-enolpyruvyl-6-hydroxy-3-cyclohexene-1-carboxylic-acid synthase [Vibrio sp.]
MTEDRAVVNRLWSRVILEELSRLGVEQVCVAPGSRSTPLIVEASENSKLTLHSHFDERGLGFLALGMAKASKKPVAVIVTSGTAVANLLPAIAESRLTGEKLVVLTADRPVELVGCGANQAIDQLGIFSHHVTQAINLPSPTTDIPLSWLLTTIDDAMFKQDQLGGTIHINCPYPEPLYTNYVPWNDLGYCQTLKYWQHSQQPYNTKFQAKAHSSSELIDFMDEKGVIIIGSVSLAEAKEAKRLGDKLGWPVLSDPQSGISSDWAHFDIWMQNAKLASILNECEVILQFGGRIVSKRLNAWLTQHIQKTSCPYLYLSASWSRDNQNHLAQFHFVTDMIEWIEAQSQKLPHHGSRHAGWANQIKDSLVTLNSTVETLLKAQPLLTELAIATTLNEVGHGCDIFVGNSLIVRLFDMFARIDARNVYSNRGASGIDGIVATAAGVQAVTQQPMILFMGDTSLLYDLNSLALLKKVNHPFVLVVTNNDGGAIFDLLPVPKEQKQSLYQMPHGFDFRYAAMQFGLAYQNPTSVDEYRQLINYHIESGSGGLVVEVTTDNGQAAQHIKSIVESINAL